MKPRSVKSAENNTSSEAKPGEADTGETKPCETKPDETDAGKPDPGETEPGETDPGETEPGETEPGETEPGETEPGETKPGETKPGETKPGETKPGETKPGETKPDETDTGKSDTAKPKAPDAGICYRLKLTARGREIIAHQQAISAHLPKNHPDRTVTGIVEKGLRTLEEGTAAASPLRYNLLEGAELVRILGVLNQSWATLRQFRSDALHPDTISSIGPKHIAGLVTKAEEALEAVSTQNAIVTRMAYIVRNLSADDHRILKELIRNLNDHAADPKITEITRFKLKLGIRLLETFVEPPTSKPTP